MSTLGQGAERRDIKGSGRCVGAVALAIASVVCLMATADSSWADRRRWTGAGVDKTTSRTANWADCSATRPANGDDAWSLNDSAQPMSQGDIARSRGATVPALRLSIVNEAGASDDSLAAARREAQEIWADAGLELMWLDRAAAFDPASAPTVVVMVRRALVSRATAMSPHTGRPLAWVLFEHGRPTNLIEVSLSRVMRLVMSGSFVGKPIDHLPSIAQQPLIGRALGRVLAHEIGHWLGGSAHTSGGLMKSRLTPVDLVERLAPALPSAWTRTGAAPLLAESLRCGSAFHAALR
jgi:hypothetical protein